MFTIEHTHQISETEYVRLFGLDQGRVTAEAWSVTTVRWTRRIGVVALGLILFLWPYTVGLGVIILVITALRIFAPHFVPGITARNFRQMRYLREPLTYGANYDRVWVRGSDFAAEASWRHLTVWRESWGWLILQGNGFPPVLLPVSTLKAEGLYDQVKAQARQHAVEFNSAEATSRFHELTGGE